MFAYHDAGFTTWDLADHYGPAEDFIGEFRRAVRRSPRRRRLSEIQAFTKWVPQPGRMTRRVVEDAVGDLAVADGRRTSRPAAIPLVGLRRQALSRRAQTSRGSAARRQDPPSRADQFRHRAPATSLPSTASGSSRTRCSTRWSTAGPRSGWPHSAAITVSALLAYGTLLGGLLSEKYLGRPEPRRSELDTASLQKYKHMIDAWGGWSLFQELLAALKQIADKHRREHRQCRRPLHAGPPGGGGRHRRRAARRGASTSPTTPACSASRSTATISR